MRLMKQLLLMSLLCCGLVFGYATNRDGSVLYFSSPLRMRGTAQHFYPKIFVWEAGQGVRLFLEGEREIPIAPMNGFVCAEPYLFSDADVSADGLTIELNTRANCAGVSPGGFEPLLAEFWSGGIHRPVVSGTASMSRNGRYALSWGSESSVFPSQLSPVQVTDLTTGRTNTYQAYKEGSVSNDGTALLTINGFLVLAQGGETKPLGFMGSGARISETGERIVYQTRVSASQPTSQLYSWSVATGRSTLLIETCARFLISDDASVITCLDDYSAPGHLFVIGADVTGRRQLNQVPDSSWPVAMSGDGKVLFVSRQDPRTGFTAILRVDIASGQYATIIAAIPNSLNGVLEFRAAPGELILPSWIGLGGTSSNALPPFPTVLGGISVRINGTPVPVASVTAEGVQFQVPWDLPDGDSTVEIEGPYLADGVFVAGNSIRPADASFYTRRDNSTRRAMHGDYVIVAAHQSFDRLVSDADPARAGEVVISSHTLWGR